MLYPYLAAVAVALLSLSGIVFAHARGGIIGMHRFWIPLSAGVFLGVVFFELVPETILAGGDGGLIIAAGFLGFFFLSHLLRRDHDCAGAHDCGSARHTPQTLLIGDGLHNFSDGVLLVSAFALSPHLGLITTLAVALHEIPQEIAEYSVLRKAGYSHSKALRFNFLSALTILLGVVAGQLFIGVGDTLWIVTGLVAGNLLYIIASDLLPELQSEQHQAHFYPVFLSLLVGVGLMFATITFSHSQLIAHDDHEAEAATHSHDDPHTH